MLRSFITKPTRARVYVVLAGLLLGQIVIEKLTNGATLPLLIWFAAILATAWLMRVPARGGVTNLASVVTGRPVALTARGRALVNPDPPAAGRVRRALRHFVVAFAVLLLLLWLASR